jgi:hypothetical protein
MHKSEVHIFVVDEAATIVWFFPLRVATQTKGEGNV